MPRSNSNMTKPRLYCSAYGCLNSTLRNPQLSYFNLPANAERRYEWLRLISREDLINKRAKSYSVCEQHFYPQDVLQAQFRKNLKKNALPCLQLHKSDKATMTDLLELVDIFTQTEDMHPTNTEISKRLSSVHSRKRYSKLKAASDFGNTGASLSCRSLKHAQRSSDDRKRKATSSRSESDEESEDDIPEMTTNATGTDDFEFLEHEGVRCDECGTKVVGFRYKCVQCANCDICAECESLGAHPNHYVLRIPRPLPFTRVKEMQQKWRQVVNIDPNNQHYHTVPSASIKHEVEIKMEPNEESFQTSDPLDTASDMNFTEPSIPEEIYSFTVLPVIDVKEVSFTPTSSDSDIDEVSAEEVRTLGLRKHDVKKRDLQNVKEITHEPQIKRQKSLSDLKVAVNEDNIEVEEDRISLEPTAVEDSPEPQPKDLPEQHEILR